MSGGVLKLKHHSCRVEPRDSCSHRGVPDGSAGGWGLACRSSKTGVWHVSAMPNSVPTRGPHIGSFRGADRGGGMVFWSESIGDVNCVTEATCSLRQATPLLPDWVPSLLSLGNK